jgi:anti-anti-sigma factor
MEISRSEDRGGWTVLVVSGRVDHGGAPLLEETCRTEVAKQGCSLALDLSAVTFISSAGLRALLTAYKELGPVRGRMALVGAQSAVRDVLDLSGFSAYLPLVNSLAELR